MMGDASRVASRVMKHVLRRRNNLATWFKAEDWRERIITFDPSWFIVCMGTGEQDQPTRSFLKICAEGFFLGIIVELLTNFPYPAQWLRNLAYCFWVVDIVLFVFFTVMSVLRLVWYPKVAINVLADFQQTSFLGAIPVALDTVVAGIDIFYSHRSAAVWAAFALFWASVALTATVIFGSVFVMYHHQGEQKLSDVTGVWLLTFIPPIVISATGATVASYLSPPASIAVLLVSFMMWSLGLGMSYIVTAVYFWRIIKCKLPAGQAIISCFVPVGPLGMGAFAIQNLAVGLSRFVSKNEFTLARAPQPTSTVQVTAAIAEGIHWIGVIVAFALLGLATFFLVEAIFSAWVKFPRSFNIGFWAFVFPCGVYSNALCRLSTDIRNDGLKGFAATCVVATVLLWVGCMLATMYRGIWLGKLFYAPGLQGWAEEQLLDQRRQSVEKPRQGHAMATGANEYDGHTVLVSSGSDGTYAFLRRGLEHDSSV